MCLGKKFNKHNHVKKVFDANGDIVNTEQTDGNLDINAFPAHIDNALLDTSIPHGVLGFRYQNKEECLIVYSTVETKTYCYIMGIIPIKQ